MYVRTLSGSHHALEFCLDTVIEKYPGLIVNTRYLLGAVGKSVVLKSAKSNSASLTIERLREDSYN
jgi:hypothetical protein